MAFTFDDTPFVRQGRDNWSTHKVLLGIYDGPASYTTGGDSFLPESVGWSNFDLVLAGVATDGTDTRLIAWDGTNHTLLWFVPNTNAEVANGTDLSTFRAEMLVAGHG